MDGDARARREWRGDARGDPVGAGRKVERALVQVRRLLEFLQPILDACGVVRYAVADAAQVGLDVPPARKRRIIEVSYDGQRELKSPRAFHR